MDQASLSPTEAEALVQQLPLERSIPTRAFMWRLLLSSPRNELVRRLALQWLQKTGDPHRRFAMQYLRRHYLELLPGLAQRYENDPDGDLQYELAGYVLTTDTNRGLHMMIRALETASDEVCNAIHFEIETFGNFEHLAELRRRDENAGGGTFFARIADALDKKLKGG